MLYCLGHTLQRHRLSPRQLALQEPLQAACWAGLLGTAGGDVRAISCLGSAEMYRRTAETGAGANACLTLTLACMHSTAKVNIKTTLGCQA